MRIVNGNVPHTRRLAHTGVALSRDARVRLGWMDFYHAHGRHRRGLPRPARGRMPFPVRAIQVDGGSEFQAAFEAACQARGIRLFVLPPRSPKLNGCVQRAQRTHTEEFYEVTPP